MKSIKLKTLITAASFFAFSAAFSQDTTTAPKPDTSKWPSADTTNMPKHDSTSMTTNANTSDVSMATTTEAAKKQAKAEKKLDKATSAKLPE